MRHASFGLLKLTSLLCILALTGLSFSQAPQEKKPKRFDPGKMDVTARFLTNSQEFTAKDVSVEEAIAKFAKLEKLDIRSGLLKPEQLAAKTSAGGETIGAAFQAVLVPVQCTYAIGPRGRVYVIPFEIVILPSGSTA